MKAPDRPSEEWPTRSIEIGTAAEHLVCCDLLLAGTVAFMSSAGLPYDVVANLNGRLIRIAVKSTLRAKPRPAREGSRVCWPQDMRGDNSNRIKALEDFLAYMRITPDDRFERKLDAGFSRHVEPGTCAVTVWTLRP